MKHCNKCETDKADEDFSPSHFKKKSGWCRLCVAFKNKKYKEKNPEKVKANNKKWAEEHPEKVAAANKKWAKENPEKVAANSKKWAEKNPEKNRAKSTKWAEKNPEKVAANNKKWAKDNAERKVANDKKWREENPEKVKASNNKKKKKRYKNDPAYRNRTIASCMVNKMLKSQGSLKNGESSGDYFPWTPEELWDHFLDCMKQPGNEWMRPDNQGVYDPKTWDDNDKSTWFWQLDHIIPQSDLPYDTMDHSNFQKTWALSNLRPYSAKQNILDGTSRVRHSNISNQSLIIEQERTNNDKR